MNLSRKILTVSFILALNLALGLKAEVSYVLSDEEVSIDVKKGAFKCIDKTLDDGGFRHPTSGSINLSEKDIFDRTLRLKGISGYLSVDLPDSIDCAALNNQINNIPSQLFANRKVYRVITNHPSVAKSQSNLISKISIEIPVEVNGNNLVLLGTQSWLEEYPLSNQSFPKRASYSSLIHPQSASLHVGLFCTQDHSQYLLSFGQGSNYSTNINELSRSFPTEQACEDVRSDLLKRYEAEDPGNWGTQIVVHRILEMRYRYILDNQAKPMCQEIQLETLSSIIQGLKYSTVLASFPISTVDLSLCSGLKSSL